MPEEIQIPSIIITAIQVLLAFGGAFLIALWLSLIVWTFRDARARSRDIFAILLATLMVVVFGPLGLLLYFLLRPPITLAELYERSLEEEALLQDLEERPRCAGCSRQVHENWVVCPDCFTTLKVKCSQCNQNLHLTWNVCPFCGMMVDGQAAPVHDHHDSSGPALVEPEPKPARPALTKTRPMPVISTPPAATPPPSAPPMSPAPAPRGDETKPQLPQAGTA